MKKLIELANFGEQPLANDFLKTPNDKFSTYPLQIGFDPETCLVQLINNAPIELMFNDNYVYDSSKSQTMRDHFKQIANNLDKRFSPKSILEIGSNSGIFINNFSNKKEIVAIEPCENFAERTRDMGIETYSDYWSEEAAIELDKIYGEFDLIFASNTISHIHDLDSCFKGLKLILSEKGVLVIESPSLKSIIENNIIDQFYHEHQSYFSLISIMLLIDKYNLEVFDMEEIPVHGGSNRFYISHKGIYNNNPKLIKFTLSEILLKLDNSEILKESFKKMIDNLKDLKKDLLKYKKNGEIVIGYGATAKLSLIFNLVGIDKSLIKYILDTTPEKQNKFIPGTGIQVLSYDKEKLMKSNRCFLGAWNYKEEIYKKEQEYLSQGKKFLTHIPNFQIIESVKK